MGDGGIDWVGPFVRFAWERAEIFFGKDALTKEQNERVYRQIRVATSEASCVQCLGMHAPIPIQKIFQPVLLKPAYQERNGVPSLTIDIPQLMKNNRDSIIFSRGGEGKTTLLHWLYLDLLQSSTWMPFLYTLRRDGAIDDLREFVHLAASGKMPKKIQKHRIALLVDGFDEIQTIDRPDVIKALLEFQALNVGNFYLTCRTHYAVNDLAADRFELEGFARDDSIAFVKNFSKEYGVAIEPESLIDELKAHHLNMFASHPLLLALVCILKTGPTPLLPRTPVKLMERAVNTLTFRWDQDKNLQREARTAIDGEDRIECLKRVAYHLKLPAGTEQEVHDIVRKYLQHMHMPGIDVRKLLTEIAQFFGILVPMSDTGYVFVDRTIHDYLAARYAVNSRLFNPAHVGDWNSRAAYAVCMMEESSTEGVVHALEEAANIEAFSECLYNDVGFDSSRVAEAIIKHFEKFPRAFTHETTANTVTVFTKDDFFALVTTDLLDSLISAAPQKRKKSSDLVAAYAFAEFLKRGKKLNSRALYDQFRIRYGSEQFEFRVSGGLHASQFRLRDLFSSSLR